MRTLNHGRGDAPQRSRAFLSSGWFWVLAPILLAALVVGLLALLRGADGVPFVYTLF